MPTVGTLMSKRLVSIPAEVSAEEAAQKMSRESIGSLFVTRNGDYVGILTEVDIVRKVVAPRKDPAKVFVGSIMSAPLVSLEARRSLIDANDMMERHRIRHLGVTEGGKLSGILSVRDLLTPFYMEQAASGF